MLHAAIPGNSVQFYVPNGRSNGRSNGHCTHTQLLLACCWHVAGMLLACCWHVAGMLLACCWHVAGCSDSLILYSFMKQPEATRSRWGRLPRGYPRGCFTQPSRAILYSFMSQTAVQTAVQTAIVHTHNCCWHAAGMLLACCWHVAGMLLACCWHVAGMLLVALIL